MNEKLNKIKLLNEFINKCKEKNIWYIASGETLYSAVKYNDLIIGDDMPEISMTIASYEKFKMNFPKSVNDATMDHKYPFINPRIYFESNKNIKLYINVKIIVPTTAKKIKQFTNMLSKINFSISKLHTTCLPKTGMEKIITIATCPFKKFAKKESHKSIYNKLFTKTHEGYLEIFTPWSSTTNNWVPNLTFKTINIHLNMIQIDIPAEYNLILVSRYGSDYMNLFKKAQ